jgi:ankyrin repeat protein
VDAMGNTPLHYAAKVGDEGILDTILTAMPK